MSADKPPEIHQGELEALFSDPTGPVGKIIEQRTIAVEGIMKALLLIPGSGRLYTTRFWRDKAGRLRRGGPRPPHRASAPGMPPASDTGQLLNSIGHQMVVDKVVKGRVHARKKYAIYLEEGTRYMDPRPFMKPALEAGVKLK